MIPIAIAQIRPRKADYARNMRRLGDVFAQVSSLDPVPRLVVTPETVTTGYFVEGGVRELAVTAGTLFRDLTAQHAAVDAPPVDVVVGFYEDWRNQLYNSAMYASLGGDDPGIRHVHRKVFLPTYGVFDEARFVSHGRSVEAFDTPWGRAAVVICEDAWHSIVPTVAALDGAQVLIIVSASPAWDASPSADQEPRPGNVRRWERLAMDAASEHGIYVVLSQLVGFEGGKAFCGSSLVVGPDGHTLVRGPLFEEALVSAVLDPESITRVRADQSLLDDLRLAWPTLVMGTSTRPAGGAAFDLPTREALTREAERSPTIAVTTACADRGDDLTIDCDLVHRWLVEFLRDEVRERRGFTKGIVGLSGGVDSSLTAFLAAEALGAENVIGVRMPHRTSSPESLEHAQLVADTLGIRCETVDITGAVDGYLAEIDADAGALRRGNVMARQRMIVLFDLSAREHALPLGTGNKSERLLGYFTWHADDSPPVNPLGDLFKTQVWDLARHVGVPAVIVDKPATADLVHGQTDETDLGVSYPVADRILHDLLHGFDQAQIVARGYDPAAVDTVRTRLQSTHWKRRLPTTAMISRSAIGEYYLRPVDY